MDKLKTLPFAYILLVALGVAAVAGQVYTVRILDTLTDTVTAKMYLEVLEPETTLEATESAAPTGATGAKGKLTPTLVKEEVK